jgi:hypothetical protein
MGEESHMTQFRRLARSSTLAAAVACAFAVAWTALPCVGNAKAASQQAQQPGKESKESQEAQQKQAAQRAYDAGLKAFANGRYQAAIDQLSAALKSSGLSSTETAKALYKRGIAYKKQKQPGLAISDLTSALWLKNGLSGSERETATAERAEAYKMAGIQDTGKGPERVIGTDAASTTSGANASSAGLSAAAIAEAASNANKSNDSSSSAPVTRQDASSESAQEAARARAAYAPVDSLAGSTVTAGNAQTAPATPSTSIGSSVTGFFSNLFGGSSSAQQPAAPEQPAGVTTASTSPAPVVPEVSSWNSATVVNEGHAVKPSKPSEQKHHATAAAEREHTTKGKYKVHIAALRSRAEAEALAQRLVAQHGADLDNHVPTVDKAVIGSMGTFYRVRIGGYASQEEPRGLCNKLRTSGLDCLVVTN